MDSVRTKGGVFNLRHVLMQDFHQNFLDLKFSIFIQEANCWTSSVFHEKCGKFEEAEIFFQSL